MACRSWTSGRAARLHPYHVPCTGFYPRVLVLPVSIAFSEVKLSGQPLLPPGLRIRRKSPSNLSAWHPLQTRFTGRPGFAFLAGTVAFAFWQMMQMAIYCRPVRCSHALWQLSQPAMLLLPWAVQLLLGKCTFA